MSLFDDLKAKADVNDDDRINKDDLDALRNDENAGVIDKLKAVADQNDDGKIGLEDAKSFNVGNTVDDAKKLF